MSNEEDFILALRLQEQFDAETNMNQVSSLVCPKPKKKIKLVDSNSLIKESSVVDPSWEYIDPTPDVHALFIQFDRRFFWGALKHVEVRWSPRMTSCAGICCYEGRGGLCSIRLSVPLLKLRPRKDMVETLLHEMIHAYLFVTHNNRDRDGHGPQFHEHMYRINKEAGTNITVYHSFHNEVKLYKQHWWRCDGPCQKRPPYYGMVKRSMNRAPGPNDFWWNDHEKNCGGRYIKVKEPTGFSEKKAKQGFKNSSDRKMGDIRSFLSIHGNKSTDTIKNESVVPHKPTKINNIVSLSDLSTYDGVKVTSSNNGVKDLNGTSSVKKQNKVPSKHKASDKDKAIGTIFKSPVPGNITEDSSFSGKSRKTGGLLANKGSGTLVVTAKGNNKEHTSTNKVQSNFVPFSGKGNKLGTPNTAFPSNEIYAYHHPNESGMCLKRHSSITENNVNLKRSKNNITDLTADSKDEQSNNTKTLQCPVCGVKVIEDDINSHLDSCIEFEVQDEVAVVKSDLCPTCNKLVSNNNLNVHLKNCSAVTELESDLIKCPACNKSLLKCELSSHLETCLESIFGDKTKLEDVKGEKDTGIDDEYPCPCCTKLLKHSMMNSHLDLCLASEWDDFNQQHDLIH